MVTATCAPRRIDDVRAVAKPARGLAHSTRRRKGRRGQSPNLGRQFAYVFAVMRPTDHDGVIQPLGL